MAGASLMPSPMNPTVCWRDCSAVMMRCLCAGETRANSVVFSAASASCSSVIFSTSSPSSTNSVARPTSLQILRATRSLSPVTTLTVDAVRLQRRDGRRGGLLRRIEERDVAVQDQVASRRPCRRAWRRRRRRRAAPGPWWRWPAPGSRRRSAARIPSSSSSMCWWSIGRNVAVELEGRARREDRFGRALGDDAVLAFRRADDDRHDAALEVEGDLVDLRVLGDVRDARGVSVCASTARSRTFFRPVWKWLLR